MSAELCAPTYTQAHTIINKHILKKGLHPVLKNKGACERKRTDRGFGVSVRRGGSCWLSGGLCKKLKAFQEGGGKSVIGKALTVLCDTRANSLMLSSGVVARDFSSLPVLE